MLSDPSQLNKFLFLLNRRKLHFHQKELELMFKFKSMCPGQINLGFL